LTILGVLLKSIRSGIGERSIETENISLKELPVDRPEFLRACRTPRSLWLVVMGALALFPACGSERQTAWRLPPNPGRKISVRFDALRFFRGDLRGY
jgi:hypothetical protein